MPTDEELEHLKKQTSNPGACMKCQEEVERLRYREKHHLYGRGLDPEMVRQRNLAMAQDRQWQDQQRGLQNYMAQTAPPPGKGACPHGWHRPFCLECRMADAAGALRREAQASMGRVPEPPVEYPGPLEGFPPAPRKFFAIELVPLIAMAVALVLAAMMVL